MAYIPLDLTGGPERADCRKRDEPVTPAGCAPVLVHVPSFEQSPRGAPNFLVYPVTKAYRRHCLGTLVPTCLGVGHAASHPEGSQALGCSLSPRPQGGVTCMAWAASVPGLRTLGFLLVCCTCVWVLGSADTLPSWATNGVVRARVWILAFVPPFLAGASGLPAWIWVLPFFLFSCLGFMVCAFWYGLCPSPATCGWSGSHLRLGMGFA